MWVVNLMQKLAVTSRTENIRGREGDDANGTATFVAVEHAAGSSCTSGLRHCCEIVLFCYRLQRCNRSGEIRMVDLERREGMESISLMKKRKRSYELVFLMQNYYGVPSAVEQRLLAAKRS